MPDYVDPASLAQEVAGNATDDDNADHADSAVLLPTDNPLSAMDKAMTSREGAAGVRRSKCLPVIMLWLVAIIVTVVDQASKQWAFSALSDGRHTAPFGRVLGLVLVRDPSATFSFTTGQAWIFALIASYVVAIIIRVSRNLTSGPWAVTLSLVLNGAVDNLVDHLLHEPDLLHDHVIGFIGYGGYFMGNVADIAIVAAATGTIILSLGDWEIDGTRAGASDDPEAEGGGAPPSSTRRGVRARGEDRAETSSRPGEPLDVSAQATPVEPQ